MSLSKITKPIVIGGVVAATMFSPIQPLRFMDFGGKVAYAANPVATNVVTYEKQRSDYIEGSTFKDVQSGRWYASAVKQAYEFGLISGRTETSYDPQGNLTVAEAITLAVKLHSYGSTGTYEISPAPSGSPWYTNIVDYAFKNGIIKMYEWEGKFNQNATRAEVAHIFANVYGEGLLPKINKVTSLPDVRATDKYADDIYALYEAGILSGSDANGTFNPNSPITRAEIASIVMRMALPTQRVSLPKYDGGAVPTTNDFPRVPINDGSGSGNTGNQTTTDKPEDKPTGSTTDKTETTTEDKPSSSTGNTSGTTDKPSSSTGNTSGTTDKPTTKPEDKPSGSTETKPENNDTIVENGFTYVNDGSGTYYIYCTADTDLDKLVAKNGYKVSEFMSPGIDPADIAFVPYSGNSAVIELQPPTGAKEAYLSITPVEEESTRPDPEEYADWFFEIFRNHSKVGLKVGIYDERPANYPECAAAIINHLRDEYGVPHVEAHPALNAAADIRAKELATSFSHTRPNGGDLYDLWLECGYKQEGEFLLGVGEDIAGGTSLAAAMSAWIDSPGHLRPMIEDYDVKGDYFTHIGIGYYEGGGMALVFGQD